MSIRSRKTKAQKQLDDIAGVEFTLGALLNAIRQGEEDTLEIFSSKLGVSKQYLCDLEKGRRFASPKSTVNYAETLGYSESQFLKNYVCKILWLEMG